MLGPLSGPVRDRWDLGTEQRESSSPGSVWTAKRRNLPRYRKLLIKIENAQLPSNTRADGKRLPNRPLCAARPGALAIRTFPCDPT
jgi:hypothetical protein